ncbi:hypothetical protein BK654_16115 [Pseudomonas brassicacearum]|uniref:DUF2024 family protein n=1 Tax=Pseudomonas brassicacearum TaxID=930166 RepID=UPI000F4A9A9A|nr:DUF2024 family protein [Pseudomonas brassicacearum]ROM76169.1 hypothetical protein BK654_16115 [Pseudomonas brassicacearum]
MTIKVYDTHVHTQDGRYLHFDVLIDRIDQEFAQACAQRFLAEQGIEDQDITLSECRFCHVEPGNPEIGEAIARQGFFILKLQGCEA